MSEEILEVDGLTKVFNGTLTAVDHVSFSVAKGEVFGFLGPNGAGKTTAIHVLTTVLKPTEGKASVCGYDISANPGEVRASIGVVPQDYTSDEDLTGYENIILCGDLYGIPREVSKQRAEELLKLVELTDAKDKKVENYSGGMRRRLELACGLINRPTLLFLDEPTLGLDVQTRIAVWKYIRLMREEYNMTLFMTTHYLEEADSLCDRIAIIDNGKIVKIGKPEVLKASLGGDIMEITLNDDADATKLISKVKGVKGVKKSGAAYRIKLMNGEETAPEIMETLSSAGHKVIKLALTKPTLDEVYLEYTGRSMREAQEGAADVMRQRHILRRARRR